MPQGVVLIYIELQSKPLWDPDPSAIARSTKPFYTRPNNQTLLANFKAFKGDKHHGVQYQLLHTVQNSNVLLRYIHIFFLVISKVLLKNLLNISCKGFSWVESHTGKITDVMWPYPLLTRKDLASLTTVSCLLVGDTYTYRLSVFSCRCHKYAFFSSLYLCGPGVDIQNTYFSGVPQLVYRQFLTPEQGIIFHLALITRVRPCVSSRRIVWWIEVVAKTFTLRLEFLWSLGDLVSVSLSA